ncbi:CapA family protein [Alicyclobacillus dauci]|uniref:CapA family protein n=1 Tax=Alicyclobacillus dauci TaxID=1475485 RepID=A0ABY6Z5A7_9BACL|nr:CapA family protein [Alicyclobacillus dauci]WAH37997.1 CapA family protein [Alicyclobacillus dauci]
MAKISIMATGDSFITQRLPRLDERVQSIRELLGQVDARFTNLEVTIHEFGVYPSAVSGGTWAAARPPVLSDLSWLGFNMLAWANNHTLDWSHHGLLETHLHLEKEGFIHAGVGHNLAEASQPRYLETRNGRIALIGVNSTLRDWHPAGEQRRDVLGRPGVNPLRFETVHRLSIQDFHALQAIIAKTDVNAVRLLSEQEGFSRAREGMFHVDHLQFETGEPGTITRMTRKDAERIG